MFFTHVLYENITVEEMILCYYWELMIIVYIHKNHTVTDKYHKTIAIMIIGGLIHLLLLKA